MRSGNRLHSFARTTFALLMAALLTFALMLGLAELTNGAPDGKAGSAALQAKLAAAKAGQKKGQSTKNAPKQRVRVAMAALPKQKEDKPKPPPPEDMLNGQIVETAKPLVEEVPQNAKYLGKYDVATAKEQKSKGQKTIGASSGRLALNDPSALQSPQSNSKDPTQIPQHAHKPVAGSTGAAGQEALKPATVMAPGVRPEAEVGEAKSRPSSPVIVGANDGLLLPSTSARNVLHNIQALSGSPGGNDYLPDVDDEGDTNVLNTRKFRYWDFFQRVKDKIANEWEPNEVWRAHDPTGQKYGVKDRYTVLRVTLDREGIVKKVRVMRESGLDFLDAEASRAFMAASPFPNPPKGLQNSEGDVDVPFGFMFEISNRQFRFLPPHM